MKKRRLLITAGVLYCLLAFFTVIILARWSAAGVSEALKFLDAAPQFTHSFIAVPVLAVVSAVMAVLLFRGNSSRPVLVAGCIVAAFSIVWNVGAVVLWALPVTFMWFGNGHVHDV